MVITKDHIGGLVFLCLSAAYGFYTGDISMLPGDEYEPFNAQTLPNILAIMGIILSLALIVTASRNAEDRLSLKGYDFPIIIKLLALVVLFSFALEWVGFLISTIFFLVGGYWLLGERRPKTLIIASVPFAVFIWFALSQLLDIYLAPGRLITMLFGG
ncbi:tripartite tricarboxylate transporter TctB family protein [Marinomonas mediterranea]|uniref:tripartite tricarboxylate transporter TctB family protein n=1 Tax=Marinomonas mediterranea TaxID=119864 RepID=UPI00234BE09B|nr:tripartite tricarboxylate transporter TctB family protein [Marinomonas mediterranea]WCN10112.1 tripartite tricarboxylate transporter TctB family protein [Marinomonas mediterranea]WCN14154.1 tripartite tricarboxylate transporter TctB family protein [Marinomonas mediterranea]